MTEGPQQRARTQEGRNLFLSAGTAGKTPGHDHTLIHTHRAPRTSNTACNNVGNLCKLCHRIYNYPAQKFKSGLADKLRDTAHSQAT